MSGIGQPNQPGTMSPGKTQAESAAAGENRDAKVTGSGVRDRLLTEQATSQDALGAYRKEGYHPGEPNAASGAHGEPDLRERVTEAATDIRDRASEGVKEVRERAADAYEDARSWTTEQYEAQRRRAARVAKRGYVRARQGRRATEDFVTENPLLIGVVGVAAGLLLGALLPRTRQEDRAIGPWSDEAREQGIRYARDMTQRGRDFVVTALDPDNLDAAARQMKEGGLRRDSDFSPSERPIHRL